LDFQDVVLVALAACALHTPLPFNPFFLPTEAFFPIHFQVEAKVTLQFSCRQEASLDGVFFGRANHVRGQLILLCLHENEMTTTAKASVVFHPGINHTKQEEQEQEFQHCKQKIMRVSQ